MSNIRIAKTFSDLLKFNPYHGKDGKFTSAPSGGSASNSNRYMSQMRFNTFMYNNQRCHALLLPEMTKEHLVGDEKYVGELDEYEIYQLPSPLFDQHGFIGIKKTIFE